MKKIFVLLSVILLATGCSMKTEYNVNIKKDKSMDLNLIMAMDEELINSLMESSGYEGEYTEEEMWTVLESTEEDENSETESPEDYGFSKEKYKNDKWTGFKYVKKINNIDDVSGEEATTKLEEFAEIEDSNLFVKKNNKYKLKLTELSEESTETGSLDDYNIPFEVLFTVTLPNKSISNNATNVSEDGKTLTWDLTKSETVELEFELGKNNNFIYFIIGGGILLLISIVLIFVLKNKKNNKNNQIVNNSEKHDEVIETIISQKQNIQPTNNAELNTISQGSNVPLKANDQINVGMDNLNIQNSNTEQNINSPIVDNLSQDTILTDNTTNENNISINNQPENIVPDIFNQSIQPNIQEQNDNIVSQNIQNTTEFINTSQSNINENKENL